MGFCSQHTNLIAPRFQQGGSDSFLFELDSRPIWPDGSQASEDFAEPPHLVSAPAELEARSYLPSQAPTGRQCTVSDAEPATEPLHNKYVVSLLSRFWETFSHDFGKLSADPIRSLDQSKALEDGLNNMEKALRDGEHFGGQSTVCYVKIVLAMCDALEDDFPRFAIEKLREEGSLFGTMLFGKRPDPSFLRAACYFLDGLSIANHSPHFDPCSGSPARHMELLLINAPLASTQKRPLSPTVFFDRYIPFVQQLLDPSYCSCTRRVHYRLASLELIRERLLTRDTGRPRPVTAPSRQWSGDSTITLVSADEPDMASFTGCPITSPPEEVILEGNDGKESQEMNGDSLFCPCCENFSPTGENQLKSLRRHFREKHLPIRMVFICEECGQDYGRETSLKQHHTKSRHNGDVKMRRGLRVNKDIKRDALGLFEPGQADEMWNICLAE
ncbi:hypothetical protein GQ53DRAFT_810517 [Thozetella sp. PMI_491]|nr:hypothetical protein GQ53DRAFT_810517 [Thozetella sp. PMI_491]